MHNNLQSPIMMVSGKKAREILNKAQSPTANHTRTINMAKERLKKVGASK